MRPRAEDLDRIAARCDDLRAISGRCHDSIAELDEVEQAGRDLVIVGDRVDRVDRADVEAWERAASAALGRAAHRTTHPLTADEVRADVRRALLRRLWRLVGWLMFG